MTMASSKVKCASCNIVICEVLAYIQNKLDVMDEDSLVRLCTSSFRMEDIETAKNLLFDSITTAKKRNILRKRAGKSQRDLYDVISLFKQTDPEHVPIFVAKDLHLLPPLSFDHIDATRLLKDILVMQNDIKNIKETYVTDKQLNEIRGEMLQIKRTSNSDNTGINYINNKRGGGGLIDSYCLLDSGPVGLPHILEKSSHPSSTPKQNGIITTADQNKSQLSQQESNADILTPLLLPREGTQLPVSFVPQNETVAQARAQKAASDENETPSVHSDKENGTELFHRNDHSKPAVGVWPKSKSTADIVSSDKEWRKEIPDSEWVTVQKKRIKNRFMEPCKGKAQTEPEVKFKAANIKVPLFINNVDKQTSEKDIIDYIIQKTNVVVTLKKINMMKQKHYNAYKIFVPHTKLSVFLEDQLWPEGIQFRRFIYYNRIVYDRRRSESNLNDMNLQTNIVV